MSQQQLKPNTRLDSSCEAAIATRAHHPPTTHARATSCGGELVDRGGWVMGLDRGALARIDRKLLAELDHSHGVQMVKVPVSDAVWSTWRRYCDVLELTMGQAVAGLIGGELATVVDGKSDGPVFDLVDAVEDRMERLDEGERALEQRASQLERKQEHVREREERLGQKAAEVAGARLAAKVGRNQPCPCGSGFKYKLCHGLLRRH